jgi:hypothetical protein
MASFASLVRWPALRIKRGLPVRCLFPTFINIFMASLADFRPHESSSARGSVDSRLCSWGGCRCLLLLRSRSRRRCRKDWRRLLLLGDCWARRRQRKKPQKSEWAKPRDPEVSHPFPLLQSNQSQRVSKFRPSNKLRASTNLENDHRFDYAVFLGFHDVKCLFQVIELKLVGRERSGIHATHLQEPQQPVHAGFASRA